MQAPTLHVSIPSNQQSWTYKSLTVFQNEAKKFGVDITIHDSGSLYKQGQEITALMSGVLDAATISMEDISGQLSASCFMALCQPFLFRNYAHVTACFEAPWAKAIFEKIQQAKLVVLTPLYLGTRMVKLYSDKDNFDYARLRIPEGVRWRELADILMVRHKELGNNDVKAACEKGEIDGDETPLPQTKAYGIFPRVKKIFDTSHKVDFVFLTVSQKAWDRLSSQEKHGLQVAAQIARKFNDEHRMQEELNLKRIYAPLFTQIDRSTYRQRSLYLDPVTGDVNSTSHPAIIEQHRLWPGLGQINCKTGTLTQLDDKGVLACWYGGDELPEIKNGFDETGLWLSNYKNGLWSEPRCIFKEAGKIVWNPVIVQLPKYLILYFRTFAAQDKNKEDKQFTYHTTYSYDDGEKWTNLEELPRGITGPIKCPPIALGDGKWLVGTAKDKKCSLETMHEEWPTLTKLVNLPQDIPLSEPCLIPDADGNVQIYFRNRHEKKENRYIMKSVYNPTTQEVRPLECTTIPNPDSGIDGLRLKDGRMLLVANPSHTSRNELALFISRDNGTSWEKALMLEEGNSEYSQPSIIQTSDGLLHLMYCWWQSPEEKNIKHVIVDPAKIR